MADPLECVLIRRVDLEQLRHEVKAGKVTGHNQALDKVKDLLSYVANGDYTRPTTLGELNAALKRLYIKKKEAK